jgi:hypothetical protein
MIFTARIFRMVFLMSVLALLHPGMGFAAQNQNPAARTNSQPGQSFKIAGTVVSATTGTPLSQARISIARTTDPGKFTSIVTSEDGHFEFSQLAAGKYTLQGAKRGFISAAYEQHEQFSTAIVTGPDFSTEDLVLCLTPMAVITGHVFDEFGDPVRNANIYLFQERHTGGGNRVVRMAFSISDDRGYYDIALLRPGNYYVSVTTKPWYAIHSVTAPDPALDVAYPVTFYGGATEADRATRIELKGGDRLQIDIHLNPVPALYILFRIPQNGPDPQNQFPMPSLQKRVFDSPELVQPEGTRQVAPGLFELFGIPPGRYTARIKNSGSGQLEQSTDLDLTRDGQDLNDTRGEPLGSLKLSFKLPGDETLPKQYTVGLQDSGRRFVGFRRGDSSGQVVFEDLAPGKYSILILSAAKQLSVVRTTSQSSDSLGHHVTITPGAALEFTASLAVGIVNIEGIVKKKDKPLAGIMVALVPKDPEAHIELFRRDQSDFDGTFLLQGVIPGSYTIVAVEDAWGFEWLQPGVLARYVQHGQNLTVGDLMRGTVHLPDPVEVQPH